MKPSVIASIVLALGLVLLGFGIGRTVENGNWFYVAVYGLVFLSSQIIAGIIARSRSTSAR